MIYYLVTEKHAYTMAGYLQSWGAPLVPQIRLMRYETLLEARDLPIPYGAWIFSDIDRLTPLMQAAAIRLRDTMSASGARFRVFNDPARSMRRYELLRTLHERGDNVYDIYRVTEARMPRRYPVFIRHEEHQQVQDQLIESEATLRQRLDEMLAKGVARDELLIVEFADTADAAGQYRKYSAFRVGDRIVPRHLMFNRHWWIKDQAETLTPEQTREELAYLNDNPHAEALMRIFQTARIEFGRIDYALLDGRIQTWEINTNPMSLAEKHREKPERLPAHEHFAQAYAAALQAIGGW